MYNPNSKNALGLSYMWLGSWFNFTPNFTEICSVFSKQTIQIKSKNKQKCLKILSHDNWRKNHLAITCGGAKLMILLWKGGVALFNSSRPFSPQSSGSSAEAPVYFTLLYEPPASAHILKPRFVYSRWRVLGDTVLCPNLKQKSQWSTYSFSVVLQVMTSV